MVRFDNIRLELDDVNECFELVKNLVMDTPAEPYFLSVLQHLVCIRYLLFTLLPDQPDCPAGMTPTFGLPTTSLLKSVCHRLSCTSLDGCDLLTSGGEGFSTVLIANCQSQSHPEV